MKTTAITVMTWVGLSIGISVGASWAMLLDHANLPHRDAVPKDWYQHHLDAEKQMREEHTESIKELHRDMKDLLTRILEKK